MVFFIIVKGQRQGAYKPCPKSPSNRPKNALINNREGLPQFIIIMWNPRQKTSGVECRLMPEACRG